MTQQEEISLRMGLTGTPSLGELRAALEKELVPKEGETVAELQVRTFDTMRALYPTNPTYDEPRRIACVTDAGMIQGPEEGAEDYVRRVMATMTSTQVLLWFTCARHICSVDAAKHAAGFKVLMPGPLGGNSTEWI